MLQSKKLVAFVATSDFGRAKGFYRDTLGLRLVGEDDFALVFDAAGTMLRVTRVQEVTPAQYTVLGWQVEHIENIVQWLANAGINLERYPGMQQDHLGFGALRAVREWRGSEILTETR